MLQYNLFLDLVCQILEVFNGLYPVVFPYEVSLALSHRLIDVPALIVESSCICTNDGRMLWHVIIVFYDEVLMVVYFKTYFENTSLKEVNLAHVLKLVENYHSSINLNWF